MKEDTTLESRLKFIYILLILFKTQRRNARKPIILEIISFTSPLSFAARAKIICHDCPDVYWQQNSDQLYPIECAKNDSVRVLSIVNAYRSRPANTSGEF